MPKAEAKPGRQRRQRGSINADDIVSGAFEVARRGSLDQMSMPGLAEHLDVGVTSIYWYFRRKEDLLGAMTEVAVQNYVAAMPAVSDDETWQQVLVSHCHTLRTTHISDDVLSDLLLMRPATYSRDATRRVFETEEAILARLVAAGFTAEEALRTFNAASVYTRGMIIHDRILRLNNAATVGRGQRRMTDWTTMPVLESLVDDHPLAGTSDEDFEFGLERLIGGFETFLAERDASGAAGRTRQRARPTAAAKATTAADGSATAGEPNVAPVKRPARQRVTAHRDPHPIRNGDGKPTKLS